MRSKSSLLFGIGFVVVAIFFFAGTLLLPLASGGDLYTSPDETANAFFATQFSQNGNLRVSDPLSEQFGGQLYPRSMVVRNGNLLPQSFLGLPVFYGIAQFFFGRFILFVLTPLLVILSALAFRATLRSWFPAAVTDLSALLVLLHPSVWYYSARGLMHNVLFVCLLLCGVYFLVRQPLAGHLARCVHRVGALRPFQRWIDPVFAGGLFGLAIFVRASELYWILACVLVYAIIRVRKNKQQILLLGFGLLVGILPFFVMNTQTYGHPLVTGYTLSDRVGSVPSLIPSALEPARLVLPFGLDLRAVTKQVRDYGLLLFWWLSIPAFIGFWIVMKSHRWYVIAFCALAVWLGIWYGSWVLFDNPDHSQITIANSYIRYWLPVFVLSVPLIAQGILWIGERTKSRTARRIVIGAMMLLTTGLSTQQVFFEGQDGLLVASQKLVEMKEIKKDVLANTEPNAVIIVDRADKLFFPDRHVRYPFRSEETYTLMPTLVQQVPLYYFGITFPQKDVEYLNAVKLKELGLQIEWIKTFDEESFYRISRDNF